LNERKMKRKRTRQEKIGKKSESPMAKLKKKRGREVLEQKKAPPLPCTKRQRREKKTLFVLGGLGNLHYKPRGEKEGCLARKRKS